MVFSPFRNRVQFVLESILLSGTLGRLFVAAVAVFLIACLAGLFGFIVAHGSEQAFDDPPEAIWWAFLRLTDPGYLGDDSGAFLRVVSTVVTIAGYVLFMGVLVAILTQGLNERIRKLEMGLTPISANKHIILLGWSNRTPWIVQKFLVSEGRVNRFLQRLGVRRLKLVLLVEEVSAKHSAELRNYTGRDWASSQVILRSGSPLRLDHLMRVDYLRAGVILLPAHELRTEQGVTRSDDATLKTILSIAHSLKLSNLQLPPPLLVAELYDARKMPIALRSYQGPIELVAGDEVISRMIAQMTRHPHIGAVYRELLSTGFGNEVFVRDCGNALTGKGFWHFASLAERALVIGVTRMKAGRIVPFLNPPAEFTFEKGDKIVYIAKDWGDLDAIGEGETENTVTSWPESGEALTRPPREDHKLLILGWSRRIPALLEEYESCTNQRFEITLVSRYPINLREEAIRDYGVHLHKTKVHQKLADYTLPECMEALNPSDFHTVICLSSESSSSDEDADARTLIAFTILKNLLETETKPPRILLELLDELNVSLIHSEVCEHLLSTHILGYMLVEISLRREINAVFQELFNSSDTEILFRDFARYGLKVGETTTFETAQKLAHQHNEIALGIFKAAEVNSLTEGNHLNPDRQQIHTLEADDKWIVLRC